MSKSCFHCGYCRKEKDEDSGTLYYCADRDCYVDPFEPDCNG